MRKQDAAVEPIHILLAEDNEDDIVIVKRAFKKLRLLNNLTIVRNGREALDYLFHEGSFAESKPPTPGLVLLDISMPMVDGFEVLTRIKSDDNLKKTPVIMLTTSDREEDIVKSYEFGACSFITKPANFNDFVRAIEHFELYWTLVSRIP